MEEEKTKESHNIAQIFGREIVFNNLLNYNNLIRKSYSGNEELDLDNQEMSRVRYLRLAISELMGVIDSIIADVDSYQKQQWLRQYKKKDEREEHPYEDEETDTKILEKINDDLQNMNDAIEFAKITPTEKDDFVTVVKNEKINGFFVNKRFYLFQRKTREYYSLVLRIMNNNGMKMYSKDDENWEKSLDDEIEEAFSI